jgi:7,8-dihydropterin-6-yl-methyl-4-(beta-D-ribofuranosyl)aminobenzene 5'-phosphate synthase
MGVYTWSAVLAALLVSMAGTVRAEEPHRITNLYDAFGASSALTQDWGFAALIEYGGKRILFDTGNDAAIFEHNVRQLGVDLGRLDAVVISHRHGDHTSGLKYLVKVNPRVTIYTPLEGAYFKGPLPPAFLARAPGLPQSQQYFAGKEPTRWATGSPWEEARFQGVAATTEILPGFYLLTTKSQKPGTIDMNELSLAVRTPKGLAVVVGCSHPGVENILAAAAAIDPHLYAVMGGFHLVVTPEAEVRRVAALLHDDLRVERVAPAHCTSELGFSVLMEMFEKHFDAAGLGAVISLP